MEYYRYSLIGRLLLHIEQYPHSTHRDMGLAIGKIEITATKYVKHLLALKLIVRKKRGRSFETKLTPKGAKLLTYLEAIGELLGQ